MLKVQRGHIRSLKEDRVLNRRMPHVKAKNGAQRSYR